MDKEQFIIWLRKYGTEPNVKVYREEFQTNLEENQDNVYTELIKYYQSVDNKTKENLIQCIRLIVEDSVSIVLGLLDGTSNINQEG